MTKLVHHNKMAIRTNLQLQMSSKGESSIARQWLETVKVPVKCRDGDRGLVMHRDKDRGNMLNLDRDFNVWECGQPELQTSSKGKAPKLGIIADLLFARLAGRRLCTHCHKKDADPNDRNPKSQA
ncbi:hypothetical protein Syun_009650 [Stephania yunnanensis]|uniref:Uncharacterized protein n=1 Tax=Stephania yunnanensis TaxID=152371 RepID=A0AAP0KEV0_9MAGN